MSELRYGFDSSLSHFGYAVMERFAGTNFIQPLAHFIAIGVLVTKPVKWKGLKRDEPTKTADHQRRFEQLAVDLRGVIERHGRPTSIAVEAVALPFGKTGLVTVSALGRARGLVDGLAAEHRLSVREFSPQALKRAACGSVTAEKADVIDLMGTHYPELRGLFAQLAPGNVEHAADACAAIHAALTQENHHAEAHQEA